MISGCFTTGNAKFTDLVKEVTTSFLQYKGNLSFLQLASGQSTVWLSLLSNNLEMFLVAWLPLPESVITLEIAYVFLILAFVLYVLTGILL